VVDLPGYGYARVPGNVQRNWQKMMQSYLQNRQALAGVIQLIDSRHPPSPQDVQMVQWLLEVDIPFCLVLTKMDKLKQSERAKATPMMLRTLSETLELPGELPILHTSSKSGEGQRQLLDWIEWVLQSARGV